VGSNIPPRGTETPSWWMSSQRALWPDVVTNATQTVGRLSTKLESIRTQTVESFLSSSQQEDLLDIASKLLSESSCERSSFAVNEKYPNANSTLTSAAMHAGLSEPATSNENGHLLPPDVMLSDIGRQLMDEIPSDMNVPQTQQLQKSAGTGVFGVSCIGSQTISPFVDDLLNVIENEQTTPASSHLSRVMFTSASQTTPDFDVVSTQTMDCDFDADDIDIDIDDLIHTETQTTDMLASYFSFADIETQTVNDMQSWDCETQTYFDLLSPSGLL